jgi:hypothetical protein
MQNYRLPLRVTKATFKSPQGDLTAYVTTTLMEGTDFPMEWPTTFSFTLKGESARSILEVGRNGMVTATVKADESKPHTHWQMGAVMPAA